MTGQRLPPDIQRRLNRVARIGEGEPPGKPLSHPARTEPRPPRITRGHLDDSKNVEPVPTRLPRGNFCGRTTSHGSPWSRSRFLGPEWDQMEMGTMMGPFATFALTSVAACLVHGAGMEQQGSRAGRASSTSTPPARARLRRQRWKRRSPSRPWGRSSRAGRCETAFPRGPSRSCPRPC
jgi:hypothetical protein